MKRDILSCSKSLRKLRGDYCLGFYYIMLAGLSVLGACLCIRKRSRAKDGIFLLVSFVALAGASAARYDVGVDYSFVYGPLYGEFLADPSSVPWEPGFKLLLGALCKVTQNYQALFVLTSVIIVALILLYYWLHSPNPFVSVFLFVALSHYYCSMNFIRQMIAAAITMYAFPLLQRRNALNIAGYFAIVLLGASFHKSALILVPFFFVNLIPINKYVLAAYAAVTAAVYFNTQRIIGLITRFWYSQYGLGDIHVTDTFEPQFTIALAAIFIVIFLGGGKLRELDERNGLYVNYAFFAMFFVLMGTRHSILDRLAMYFSLLAPVAIAIIAQQYANRLREEKPVALANKHSAALAALLLAVFGGGLAIHQYALATDHHGVVPYKAIFSQPFYRSYVLSLHEGPPLEEPEPLAPSDDAAVPPQPPAPPGRPAAGMPESPLAGGDSGGLAEVPLEELFADY
jgi:hypothetical protein